LHKACIVGAAIIFHSLAQKASAPFYSGQIRHICFSDANIAASKTPETDNIEPSTESSPRIMVSS
jgi:hypothetical protein